MRFTRASASSLQDSTFDRSGMTSTAGLALEVLAKHGRSSPLARTNRRIGMGFKLRVCRQTEFKSG